MTSPHKTLLIILDGFGYRKSTQFNAIAQARTPVWDELWGQHPHTLVSCSGEDVGLPAGQMGNSEVGHMHLGAGRIVHQDLPRINHDIASGAFDRNPVADDALQQAAAGGQALHILGLLSTGGVHSHEDHIAALIRLAARRGVRQVFLHAFLDGRDTPPRSAAASLHRMQTLFDELACGRIASICGRYYAMDRDQRWERLQPAYDMLTGGDAKWQAGSAAAALQAAYERDESDEFVQPTLVQGADHAPALIADGDLLVFMNFRADRARQLSHALCNDDFSGFERRLRPRVSRFITLTSYADDINAQVMYPKQVLHNTLGQYIAHRGLRQLRLAETEKYAHVTFFFSGGQEAAFAGEERTLVPSVQVATYDQQPEMSAREVTDKLVAAIESDTFDFIVCNYANADMVGHTGNFQAAVAAVEVLDECLGRVRQALHACGGQCLITADHGNVEYMRDAQTDQPHTAHTCEPVPLVYYGPRTLQLTASGATMSDIAPTILALMDLPVPEEMTGKSLLCAPQQKVQGAS